ncbi:MAG: hypothetical protein M4579_006331 [Chaenotheca gracillima]|nr:MAG: hypothetical protein M4579_006331 [Chaenotheca gracillima]
MLSFRAIARAAPRTISRPALAAIRRPIANVRTPSILQSSWNAASRSRVAAPFSTSTLLREKQGEYDDELVAKVDSELQMEQQMRESDELPVSVRDYVENGPFKVEDTPGVEDVVLTRKFGNEEIRVTFSIADLDNMNQDPEEFDDQAQYDEEDFESAPTDTQSGGAQSKSTVNAGRTKGGNVAVAPEDSVAPSDRANNSAAEEAEEGEEQEPSFPARVSVTITKPGQKGALHIDTMAQDGTIVIDNVYYHADSSTVPAPGTDVTGKFTNSYLGPPFGNLDDDLQVLLERYLDERGINTALALFVPDYIDFKEQREYMTWLSNVKSFVEA